MDGKEIIQNSGEASQEDEEMYEIYKEELAKKLAEIAELQKQIQEQVKYGVRHGQATANALIDQRKELEKIRDQYQSAIDRVDKARAK